MHVWSTVIDAPRSVKAKKKGGRPAASVRAIVRTSSKVRAAAALGVSVEYLTRYGVLSVNDADKAACSSVPDNHVLLTGVDVGDTINGSPGWTPWQSS